MEGGEGVERGEGVRASGTGKARVIELLAGLTRRGAALPRAVDDLEDLLRGGEAPVLFGKGPDIARALLGHLGGRDDSLPLDYECKIVLLLGSSLGWNCCCAVGASLAAEIIKNARPSQRAASSARSKLRCPTALHW